MSLYALPVSTSDLTQLQLGIEFFTNVPDATDEAALINAGRDTVQNYANPLLFHNISLSQVAMAVDSLMFGVTDNTTELTKLATQFLPAQVANAVANGFNPTVYAAEALGLAVAGGNGTSNAFATDFGSLPVSQFASEVASLTGINSGAIQGFVQNWINFYTANPSATFGLSVTLASYGAAFGDAVGAALLNPTVNGTLALLVSEEQNALIDNAEGRYQPGIALSAEPSHIPLQGEALLIPGAGGDPFGATIDWAQFAGSTFDYAQFSSPQVGPLTIVNAPSTFTLDTQHYGFSIATGPDDFIAAAGFNGSLFTLILGDSTAHAILGGVTVDGYPTVHIVGNGPTGVLSTDTLTNLVVIPPAHSNGQVVISGSDFLNLGDFTPSAREGNVSVAVSGGTITDVGVKLDLGVTDAETIDASNAPFLGMFGPASLAGDVLGVTVLGGSVNNILQGSLGGHVGTVTFTNGTTGLSATIVGADNITGGPGGNDVILGDGGADTITLPPNHSLPDSVAFGYDEILGAFNVLAITDGSDLAYPGYWGATIPTAIPKLFPGPTGGTSVDITTITGFHAGSGGDQLIFQTAAWNGATSGIFGIAYAHGDLVDLDGVFVVSAGAAQLSAVWVNSGSNSSLKSADDVLLYAPSDASVHNAQQLATQLHTSSDAIVLPGGGLIAPGQDKHILVAYDAGFHRHVVNIADVDLVNTSGSNQSSTANLNVYASDMVSLTGVSLTSLTSDNIHFF
jgi:hypothetical protein